MIDLLTSDDALIRLGLAVRLQKETGFHRQAKIEILSNGTEKEILAFVATGELNSEIAEQLHLTAL